MDEETEAEERFLRESEAIATALGPLDRPSDALWIATTALRRFPSAARQLTAKALGLLFRAAASRSDASFAQQLINSGCIDLCIRLLRGKEHAHAHQADAWRVLAAIAASQGRHEGVAVTMAASGVFEAAVTVPAGARAAVRNETGTPLVRSRSRVLRGQHLCLSQHRPLTFSQHAVTPPCRRWPRRPWRPSSQGRGIRRHSTLSPVLARRASTLGPHSSSCTHHPPFLQIFRRATHTHALRHMLLFSRLPAQECTQPA